MKNALLPRLRLPFARVLLLAVAWLVSVSSAQPQNIAIPSYVRPGSKTWNSWAAYPQSVKIMIVNLDNGDDLTFHPSTLTAVQAAQAAGIMVLGYTYTEYGERNPSTVEQVISSEWTSYGVNGIFLDEAPTSCTASTPFGENTFQYYQTLYNYIHTELGGKAVLNPGTQPSTNCWMAVSDILVNWENSGITNYEHSYVDAAWVHSYPSNRFWHLLYSVKNSKDMETAFSLATQRNAGWIYVTSEGAPNPWDNLPTYWETEATLK